MSRIFASIVIALAILLSTVPLAEADPPPVSPDFDIPGGHLFTQTNGQPQGTSPAGYSVTNDGGIPFWDAFQRFGGVYALGYPVTGRFTYDGYVTQAMQKVVFQWDPNSGQVRFLNTFDALHDRGRDDWLLASRQTPKPFDSSPDTGLSWDQVAARHQAFLDQNQAIKAAYFADPDPVSHFGLPVAYGDEGNSFVIRAQRATFQYWKEDVPWAKAGDVTVANGGDLAKEAGLWPAGATTPVSPDGRAAATTPTTPALAAMTSAPAKSAYVPTPGVYRAASPEYGVHTFTWGHPDTAMRDFGLVTGLGFGWTKTLLEWKRIEPQKGQYEWYDTDGLVYGAAGQGLKLIVRPDYAPDWAKSTPAPESPPQFVQDYADFIYQLVSRYSAKNPQGRIWAVEVWNEPNLADYWGGKKPNAQEYVALLKATYEAAKKADPSVTVISGGLGPTGTNNDSATPDDVFLQQMYDAGAAAYFDVLGAHAPGFKAPPEMSPEQVAADPGYGGHRVFTFRRVEDLRAIMVKNGDASKQVWITEFGWTSDPINPAYSWFRVSEDQKADYLVRAFKYAHANWAPWIGVMSIWTIMAPDWPTSREEYWWSIVDKGGAPRSAYLRLQQARQSGELP